MTSKPPPAWYPDPVDASQCRYWDGQHWTEIRTAATTVKAPADAWTDTKRMRFNTPEWWAAMGTAFVLIPATTLAARAAAAVGFSYWAIALVAATLTMVLRFLLNPGSGKVKDGVLFGLFNTFMIGAILAFAEAVDVWWG